MLEILIGLISGIVTGIGMGGGTILILLLSVIWNYEQHIAQATNLIFFIPTILDFFLGLVDGTKESVSKYGPCTKCMLEPFSDTCKPQNLND